MRRRSLLATAAIAVLPLAAAADTRPFARVRPADPGWPDAAAWDRLRQEVGGNLLAIRSPLEKCRDPADAGACRDLFRELKNPYFIADDPALTQTCGWVGAWTSQPSVYAVAARTAHDVVAAINFARERQLRLVVRGGGHSYLGSSNAPDSLLIWTRAMTEIVCHDAFVPQDGGGHIPPVPAVSLGAGSIWRQAYDVVTTKAGRYVQGGGCVTVGVPGLVQGGGFGTHSKAFGLAGGSLLEAEIVTADGAIRVVNAVREPELFWALKGGGGGFGVVTRMTLRTWELPSTFGLVTMAITANSDTSYRRLVAAFVAFYAERLFDPHWGELVRAMPGRRLQIDMNFQGLDQAQAAAIWQPFTDWVMAQDELTATRPEIVAGPGRFRWDGAKLAELLPSAIRHDDRPGAPAENYFWASNRAEAGHVIHDYQSLWLPADLLRPERQAALADALCAASRHWSVEMHFQKGLAGGTDQALAAAAATPINPVVTRSFMLAIVASEGPPAFPGVAGHTPDIGKARQDCDRIALAMRELKAVAPAGGSYLAESSHAQSDWQRAYWGANYERLLGIKQRYDPDGLFFIRHGVGNEGWSDDGFQRSS